jgi:hypothetical protein
MELWNCGYQLQCIFTYNSSKHLRDPHKIDLRSSWNGQLSDKTVKAWKHVARTRGPQRDLEVGIYGVGASSKFTIGRDIMCALVLQGNSLTETTRKQIQDQHPVVVKAYQSL